MSEELSAARVLTIRQPYADAIMSGEKQVENRPRNVAGGYRGPVLVHAGLRSPRPLERAVFEARYGITPHPAPALGLILGVVDLVGVHPWHPNDECGLWAVHDGVHLTLANPRRLRNPIRYTGALGMRIVDDGLLARVNAEL